MLHISTTLLIPNPKNLQRSYFTRMALIYIRKSNDLPELRYQGLRKAWPGD